MGVILGTAAYMSPEQARGKPVDRRADIWAFGVVVYEMLTGARPFQGEDVSLTLASVMKSDVDARRLPPDLPDTLRTVLHRCLEKDPLQRIRDMGDVRLAMAGAFEAPATAAPGPVPAAPLQVWQRPAPAAAALLAALVIGGLAVWGLGRVDTSAPLRRFPLTPASVAFNANSGTLVGISPDGQTLIYRGFEAGQWHLSQWRLDGVAPVAIPGTEGADDSLFVSPESAWVAFHEGGALFGASPSPGALRSTSRPCPVIFAAAVGARTTRSCWG